MKTRTIDEIEEAYEALSARDKDEALLDLAIMRSVESTQAWLRLLKRFGWPSDAETDPDLFSAGYFHWTANLNPFTVMILPAIVDGSISGVPDSFCVGVLFHVAKTMEIQDQLKPAVEAKALSIARSELALAETLCSSGVRPWDRGADYLSARMGLGEVLDLLGHLGPNEDAMSTLRQCEDFDDPWVQLFSILAILRTGGAASEAAIVRVAADIESRSTLLDGLSELDKLSLFPESEFSALKYAESEMVRWLAYPTELGTVPTRIEFSKSVERTLESTSQVFDYLVFRFRTEPPHWAAPQGWMWGVSGPYRRVDFFPVRSYADTFSDLFAWEHFDEEECVESAESLMERMGSLLQGPGSAPRPT